MSKIVNRIAAVAALALAATPIIGLTAAHAAPVAPHSAPSAPIARVSFGDLTLSHPDDAREFQRRVDRASEQTCKARNVRGLSYRACLIDIRTDLQNELSPAQRSALLTGSKASSNSFAAR